MKRKPKKNRTLQVRIPYALWMHTRAWAIRTNTTVSNVVRASLEQTIGGGK